MHVLSRVRSPNPPELSTAYVRKAALNTAIDHARRTARRRMLFETHSTALIQTAPHPDPERYVSSRRLRSVIREELVDLPPARREAVGLFLAGYGVTEIARRVGCDRKRVDNLVYRGLAVLRRALRARGITPQSCAFH